MEEFRRKRRRPADDSLLSAALSTLSRHPQRISRYQAIIGPAPRTHVCVVDGLTQSITPTLSDTALRDAVLLAVTAGKGWHDDVLPPEALNDDVRVLSFANNVHLSSAYVLKLARRLPSLLALDLCAAFSLTDAHVQEILATCPRLAYLNLTNCRKLEDGTLDAIAKHGKAVRHVDLGGCFNISGAAVHTFVKSCGTLSSFVGLGLAGIEGLMEDTVQVLASRCTALQRLSLGFYEGGETPVHELIARNPGLSHVQLHWCANVDDEVLSSLAEYCPRLHFLDITGVKGVTLDALLGLVKRRCSVSHSPIDVSSNAAAKRYDLRQDDFLYWCASTAAPSSSVVSSASTTTASSAEEVPMDQDDDASAALNTRGLKIIQARYSNAGGRALVEALNHAGVEAFVVP